MADALQVVYWDTSAILSALFIDNHSEAARRWGAGPAVHLISSLAHAEACAVTWRMARDGVVPESLAAATINAIEQGIWRRINAVPDWTIVSGLAQRATLRGADLWHLGLAATLQRDLPELRMLTFDARLQEAARREDLAILRP
ncbi:MAG: type II toxin-antitoxin system VapC family toxin [Deltaproteobacteria bacterium]|nr:type II toxin-antitoxin system VapC family toxin [Deltaproteobacteria bacterium]MDL1960728.1 type II toxin-antitoxin system VapC family toxin [Deltaproteobacteria bacterium]